MSQAMLGLAADQVVSAMGLPVATMVNQRVPKKMRLENGVPTAAERKLIQDHIEQVTWVAALKPANAVVHELQDGQRIYLEVAVLTVVTRDLGAQTANSTKVKRISELRHRAIPYPIVMVLSEGELLFMAMCHIRCARKETDKTVLDGEPLFATLTADEFCSAFLDALAMRQQPRGHLYTLSAWQAAKLSGRFGPSQSTAHAAERRAALQRCRELDARIASLDQPPEKKNNWLAKCQPTNQSAVG